LRELYDQLQPYAEVNAVAGIGTLCFGSTARYLGKLAGAMGRAADAESHFARALEANRALRSPVLVAHTQLDWAAALGPGKRARVLIDEAADTAEQLGLARIARRVAELRGS
jgi:hypothetical protein